MEVKLAGSEATSGVGDGGMRRTGGHRGPVAGTDISAGPAAVGATATGAWVAVAGPQGGPGFKDATDGVVKTRASRDKLALLGVPLDHRLRRNLRIDPTP